MTDSILYYAKKSCALIIPTPDIESELSEYLEENLFDPSTGSRVLSSCEESVVAYGFPKKLTPMWVLYYDKKERDWKRKHPHSTICVSPAQSVHVSPQLNQGCVSSTKLSNKTELKLRSLNLHVGPCTREAVETYTNVESLHFSSLV